MPNLFNINEPIIFGMPIVLNPIMFIPFALSSFVSSSVALLAVKIGFIINYNPSLGMGMPWTMPKIIADTMIMGWQGAVVWLINFLLMFLVYLPFFRIADKQAFEEENK